MLTPTEYALKELQILRAIWAAEIELANLRAGQPASTPRDVEIYRVLLYRSRSIVRCLEDGDRPSAIRRLLLLAEYATNS